MIFHIHCFSLLYPAADYVEDFFFRETFNIFIYTPNDYVSCILYVCDWLQAIESSSLQVLRERDSKDQFRSGGVEKYAGEKWIDCNYNEAWGPSNKLRILLRQKQKQRNTHKIFFTVFWPIFSFVFVCFLPLRGHFFHLFLTTTTTTTTKMGSRQKLVAVSPHTYAPGMWDIFFLALITPNLKPLDHQQWYVLEYSI